MQTADEGMRFIDEIGGRAPSTKQTYPSIAALLAFNSH